MAIQHRDLVVYGRHYALSHILLQLAVVEKTQFYHIIHCDMILFRSVITSNAAIKHKNIYRRANALLS